MPKRNPEAEILEAFDKFIESGRQLPALGDGKINVTGLCKALGLRPSDAQYFHKNDTLKATVNIVCGEQNLLGIGHRSLEPAESAINARIARVERQGRTDARAAAEQSAASEFVLAELNEKCRELAKVTLERDAALARLAIFENGGIPPRV